MYSCLFRCYLSKNPQRFGFFSAESTAPNAPNNMYSCWFRCYLSKNPQRFGFLSAESTAPNAQIICIAVGSDATSREILNGSDFLFTPEAESTAPITQFIQIMSQNSVYVKNRTPADKFYRSSMNKEICFIMMLYKFLLQLLQSLLQEQSLTNHLAKVL